MTVEPVALQVVDTLNEAGIPYALVGSFALDDARGVLAVQAGRFRV